MDPFPISMFPPFALGFFGLGTGYLIWGPQELFKVPARDPGVDRATGAWGIWMPGFCQFVTGVMLFLGLTLFQVFDTPDFYMAALAFSAYGIHWFVLGWNRYAGNDPRPNLGMAVAFTILSVLGMVVFYGVGLWPVGLLFTGLTWVYVSDLFEAIGSTFEKPGMKERGLRSLGLAHVVTGLWLMYLTFATTLNFTLGFSLPA
ncbi:MAG TPA: hypothetical protein VHG70_00020 [Nocardioidaceae bacterium]|nr:hypothetical protein [Nocardioidaceae bacterium]